MTIRKNPTIIITALVLALAIMAVCLFIFSGGEDAEPVSATVDTANDAQFSEEEIRGMIIKLAKDRFGSDAYVLPLNPEKPSFVEIEGKKRYVYIYAADSLSKQEDVDNIKGLYHVDISSGEIFDNGNGKMKKIQMESDFYEE